MLRIHRAGLPHTARLPRQTATLLSSSSSASASQTQNRSITTSVGPNLQQLPRTSLPSSRPLCLPFELLHSRRFLSSDPSKSILISQAQDPAAPDLFCHWFYATDVPIAMPEEYQYTKETDPKKFTPFSKFDSERLERAYQRGLDGVEHENEIPVNEDFLFEVNLAKREMRPVYWEGAIYEVRRGTWFNSDGMPLDEKLAKELETGYIRLKPFEKVTKEGEQSPLNKSRGDVYIIEGKQRVVYSDDKTAYLLNEGHGGKLHVSFLKTVKNLPSIGATLLTRGYRDGEAKVQDEGAEPKFTSLTDLMSLEINEMFGEKSSTISKDGTDANTKDAMKIEIEQDYNADAEKSTGGQREVDHLILCVHGIGQMLGTQFQNVNFIHTINVLRKNLKKVYSENKDFQKILNDSTGENCRIQVLPISWRHKVEFTTTNSYDERLPSLEDITVNEFKPVRNLLGSVLLDVLLYYEPRYLNQILKEVVKQANDQYRIFKERNPEFSGKVSMIGHSLGSAIALDILSMQPDNPNLDDTNPLMLNFKVDNYFGIGSPVGVFNLLKHKNIGPRSMFGESSDHMKTLACENYYNIFHPCDPIGYRVEPLISKDFTDFEPESVPFLIENFNKQLSQFSNEWAQKVTSSAVNAFANMSGVVNISKLLGNTDAEAETSSVNDQKGGEEKIVEKVQLSDDQLKLMRAMNSNGRVDYALKQGYLDLTIVSSVSAHVSYFEDENVAAFILKETLTRQNPVKKKTVQLLVENES